MNLSPADIAQKKVDIEAVYQRIFAQQMQSLSFVSPHIEIEMVSLQPYQDHWMGGMITPWMLNLMIMPMDETQGLWADLRVGEEIGLHLAGNDYRFYASEVAGIGQFLACSLMSPIAGLTEHSQAVTLAKDVMRLVTSLATDEINHSRRQLWSRSLEPSVSQ
ncbi:[NiFe]-hydrogenase assembly chaperone HybE [Vibrio sp. S11_S32]|uniref:[NiFe]-hydrogenase assembly chaperone HybE n=1 Tax=Vibrio sp. S11_S32 TaxID=2720225 RepID=UPI0016803B1E|nr:[NiFe]-hydrogenase assembly chaperone HybE [Vibrio sp. S11_S32]MBD1577633.1 [NiFe]-hydrogenase assembly chaperone HybE [Vibrio sp. S11_S32]